MCRYGGRTDVNACGLKSALHSSSLCVQSVIRNKKELTMKKILMAVAGVLLALPMAASASVNFDSIAPVVFDNGNGWESAVDGSKGDSFRAKAIIDVTSDSDVNAISFDAVGDFVPQECVQFDEVTQTVSNLPVEFDMTFPNTVGSHDYVFKLYGVDGAGKDFNCTDSNAVDTFNLNDRIVTNIGDSNSGQTTGGGSGGNVGGNSGNSQLGALQALVAQLGAQVGCWSSGGTWNGTACVPKPAPTTNTKCTAIAPYRSAPAGTYSAAGVQLQSALLLDNPYAIPALKPGSTVPMGFRGPQTEAALSAYLATNQCV